HGPMRAHGAAPWRATSLPVVLDLAGRPGGRAVGVLADTAPGPALPEQVPALVERRLQLLDPRVLLLRGHLARRELVAQRVFLVDQVFDPAENLVVPHAQDSSQCVIQHALWQASRW